MINYGYFRHRFDAHTNRKLNALIDDMGIVAYSYYFTLLELYGAAYSIEKDDLEVGIHIRVIANMWRKRVDSCKRVLTKLQLSDLLVVTYIDSTCYITIPNFLKYYGSYSKTDRQLVVKKRKEKKRKEKESKENEIESNFKMPQCSKILTDTEFQDKKILELEKLDEFLEAERKLSALDGG